MLDDKFKIVTTYSILKDMVSNIVGDKADVYSMVLIGTDPHMYDTLPEDVKHVSEADIIFYNGLKLETGKGWFKGLLSSTSKEELAYPVSRDVSPLYLTGAGQEGQEDPHAWLDVSNAIKYVEVIYQAVSEKDPSNKAFYEANMEAYVQKLEELDEYIKKQVNRLNPEDRILVTSEGAFKYFAKAYGFQAAYIWEINTDNQGTPEQMKQILDIIRTENVKALFVETSINPKTMATISNETGVPIYAKVFTDSLAKEGQTGDTYISMMEYNINQIIEGLAKAL